MTPYSTYKPPFVGLSIRTFCQETESIEKVESSFGFIAGDVEFSQTHSQGYCGNKIVVISFQTGKKKEMKRTVEILLSLKNDVLQEIEERVDEERQFHIRFSKQAAFLGEIQPIRGTCPGGVVDVEIKLESHPATRERAINNFKEWLGTSEVKNSEA
ncbi:MAG: RNA-binding domain-containing protein [Candidatus Thermoplasmatota archaeon]|nr:RNA-binding domain-containing protein [Candidatus Thermoplasmatota archaeon]